MEQLVQEQPVNRELPASYRILKRTFDVAAALIGLAAAAPVLLVFSLLIVLESKGSPIFRQERLGLNGRSFTILKLRSMRQDAEKDGPRWAARQDARVTGIGSFIRRTRIDELPQLVNVLKGEMSLIGPRPERPYFYEEFEARVPGFRRRLMVKPGLTGWAQVNGGYEIGPAEKLQLDLFYIQAASLRMDVHILLITILIVCTGRGAR